MASELDHIALANRNHEALSALLNADGEHPEWVATIAFYKALQIIEACFARQGIGHGHGHSKRLEVLHDKRRGFHSLCKHYEALLEASEIARYLSCRSSAASHTSFTDYMTMEDVKTDLLQKRLMNVEMHARQFLSEDAKSRLLQITTLFAKSEPDED